MQRQELLACIGRWRKDSRKWWKWHFRMPAALAIILLFNGCARPSGIAESNKPPVPTAFGRTNQEERETPLWLVNEFTERNGWLQQQQQLSRVSNRWGTRLAISVRRALGERSIRADVVQEKLSEKEILSLIARGLRYVCDGQIEALEVVTSAAGETNCKLIVTCRLQRSFKNKLTLVQKSQLQVELPTPRMLREEDLDRLLLEAAEGIARRVVQETPANMLASRG